jgi:uncharacterized sporulation protein YeaH/YhbH (DUF444 family)
MSIQRNDWSLQRKGIIDQERHKDRVKEAIRKNLGSIVSNEAIILSDGKRTVKVPIKATSSAMSHGPAAGKDRGRQGRMQALITTKRK